MHHLNSWIKIDQLDVTCFIISLFAAQRVSNVSTSIFRSLRLIVDIFHVLYCSGSMCVGVTVWFGWGGVVSLCRLKLCFSLHKDTTPPYADWSTASACIRCVCVCVCARVCECVCWVLCDVTFQFAQWRNIAAVSHLSRTSQLTAS